MFAVFIVLEKLGHDSIRLLVTCVGFGNIARAGQVSTLLNIFLKFHINKTMLKL